MDAQKNFAYTTVATAPSPATSGTSLVLTSAADMPAAPFSATLWPALTAPSSSNAEIVRVSALVGTTATIARAQEGTTARTVTAGWNFAATPTKESYFDALLTLIAGKADASHDHSGVYEPLQTAASQAEMEAGTETAIRSMTPQRVAQAIAALAEGTKTLVPFIASDLQPPASDYFAWDTRGSLLTASFRDTTADDSALLVDRIPEGANLASGLTVYLEWQVAGTATSGGVIWQLEFARLNANNQDTDSITYDTATVAGASTANGTAGKITKVTITVAAADIDGITAGDLFVMRITRKQSNGSDTLAERALIIGGEIRSAA